MNQHNPDDEPLPIQPLLTVRQVAKILNMSQSKVKLWCRLLILEHILVERKYLFEPAQVQNFINRHRRGGVYCK